jgi:hypothetical protein
MPSKRTRRLLKNPSLIAKEAAKVGRVICGGKAHPEPPLALRSFGTPPGLSTATPHKGPDCPYTIDDATMQPCRVDYPASPHQRQDQGEHEAGSGFFCNLLAPEPRAARRGRGGSARLARMSVSSLRRDVGLRRKRSGAGREGKFRQRSSESWTYCAPSSR